MTKRLLTFFVLLAFVAVANAQTISKWKIEDVVKSYSKNNDTVYIVNFWATFCKPCIKEIPDFIQIVKKYEKQKVKLLLVSLDLPSYYPAKIRDFAKKNNYDTRIVWLNETNADHFCPLIDKKWSGSIPSTIVINNKTGYRKFIEGEMTAAEFETMVKEGIGGIALNKYIAPMNEADVDDRKRTGDTEKQEPIIFRSNDSAVYSVMGGNVSVVARINDIKVVIIKKDDLFYTYSNLRSTSLKKGDEIQADQLIGYAAPEFNGKMPVLDFYISDSEKNILLTKKDFIPRKDKRQLDHSIESRLQEPQ